MTLRRSRIGPIGLDIGSSRVKAVQVRHSASGPQLLHAANIPRLKAGEPLSHADAARLGGVLRRQGFVGDRVVVCMPPAKMLSSVMELPPVSSGAPLEQIARQELARASKCEPGGIELAWWVLPGGARAAEGTHAMAVGCRHEDAFAVLDVLGAGGLDVLAIDAPTTALATAVAPLTGDAQDLAAVVEIGSSGAQLIILLGRTVVYERLLAEFGTERLIDGLATRIGVAREDAMTLLCSNGCGAWDKNAEHAPARRSSDIADVSADVSSIATTYADALVGELRLSASYAMRRFDAEMPRVLMTGAAAAMPGLVQCVRSRLKTDCRMVGVADACSIEGFEGSVIPGPESVLALGLALNNEKEIHT